MAELWEYRTPGIPDGLFARGEAPMTKEEVRAITLSKLRLRGDEIIYDIGAGTGSIAIECALLARDGKVYAIERDGEALGLIEANKDLFGVENLEVVRGEAPEALKSLPQPDRVVIGGSGGRLVEIVEAVGDKLKSGGRIVINSVTLETLHTSVEVLERLGMEVEVTQVIIAKGEKVGGVRLFRALNPVHIIVGEKKG